jgi:hypothetical protein
VKLQADAEHQQDHPDFRELLGELLIGDVAGCIGPHQHAREQIADDRRQSGPVRDVSGRERGAQSSRQGQNQIH